MRCFCVFQYPTWTDSTKPTHGRFHYHLLSISSTFEQEQMNWHSENIKKKDHKHEAQQSWRSKRRCGGKTQQHNCSNPHTIKEELRQRTVCRNYYWQLIVELIIFLKPVSKWPVAKHVSFLFVQKRKFFRTKRELSRNTFVHQPIIQTCNHLNYFF